MKFVFWNKDIRRTHCPTTTNICHVTGFSGTETATAEIATQLAVLGHEVAVICWGAVENLRENNVVFSESSSVAHDADVFIVNFFVSHPEVIRVIKHLQTHKPSTHQIVVWQHCIIMDEHWKQGLAVLRPEQTMIIAPSRWALRRIPEQFGRQYVVPNAVNPNVFTEPCLTNEEERLGNWIFHASWERGGDVAYDVFNKYPARKQFFAAAYVNMTTESVGMMTKLGSLSKTQLRKTLCGCDYFVYPLKTPWGSVHHDTSACVVLEAMACGVIVITWKVACLPHVYGDHIITLDPPPYDTGHADCDFFGYCHAMGNETSVKRILDKIVELDSRPDEKRSLRKRASDWAAQQTWRRSAEGMEAVIYSNRTK